MRSRIVNSAVVLIMLGFGAFSYAESPVPGRIAPPEGVGISEPIVPITSSSSGVPAVTIATIPDGHDKTMKRVWIGSIFAMLAASSLDAATSWGKSEGNSLLASSDGKFGAKGLSIKAGLAGATILPQILLRRHKELRKAFTVGNLGEAAIFTGVSIHNLSVPDPTN